MGEIRDRVNLVKDCAGGSEGGKEGIGGRDMLGGKPTEPCA